MTNNDIDMTFEEYRDEFIEELYYMLEHKDIAKELIKNMLKIDFEWEYNYAIKEKNKGKAPNLRAVISSRVYCLYMCYPDMS